MAPTILPFTPLFARLMRPSGVRSNITLAAAWMAQTMLSSSTPLLAMRMTSLLVNAGDLEALAEGAGLAVEAGVLAAVPRPVEREAGAEEPAAGFEAGVAAAVELVAREDVSGLDSAASSEALAAGGTAAVLESFLKWATAVSILVCASTKGFSSGFASRAIP